MIVEHHPLIKEFPELRERIHAMKADAHFVRLSADYEAADKEIVRAEEGVEHVSDDELETMKVKRLRLKDQIYALLKD